MSHRRGIERDSTRPENDVLWRAIVTRDARFDDSFVFGVRSTGIYCRASCPARRPRRDRIELFADADAAEAAGYRACKRCRPREPSDRQRRIELVVRACAAIDGALAAPLTLAELGQSLAVRPEQLQRTFKLLTTVSPRHYTEARRLEWWKQELRGQDSVTRALYAAGFGSSSRLYERAPAQLGMTPTAYRRGGLGIDVSYVILSASLGRLLVARAERGICAVRIGPRGQGYGQALDADLLEQLNAEFPAAHVSPDRHGLQPQVAAAVARIDGQLPDPALPFDVRAAAFGWRLRLELNRCLSREQQLSSAAN